MSVQTYPYEAHFTWKWHRSVDIWAIENNDVIKAKLIADMKTAFLSQFAEKLAAEGHWFRLDDVLTNITKLTAGYVVGIPIPAYAYDVEGETVIYFQSDIKDATAHGSSQLWQMVKESILQIIAWLGDHPQIVVALVAVGILTILTVWLINTGTGAIQTLGSNVGSTVITLGILVVLGLGIYALFFTKSGSRAGTKAYQLGRRAYRKARR